MCAIPALNTSAFVTKCEDWVSLRSSCLQLPLLSTGSVAAARVGRRRTRATRSHTHLRHPGEVASSLPVLVTR